LTAKDAKVAKEAHCIKRNRCVGFKVLHLSDAVKRLREVLPKISNVATIVETFGAGSYPVPEEHLHIRRAPEAG